MAVRRVLVGLSCLALAAISGCGRESESSMPAACGAEEEVSQALESAPGEVSMGGTLLSECLDDSTSGGELENVGATYVAVATDLAAAAAGEPEGEEATQLGYLVGALRRSEAGAQGVGYELQRRIDQELNQVDVDSRAFRRGEAAGRRSG